MINFENGRAALKGLALSALLLPLSAGRAAASPPIRPQCFKSAAAAADGDIGVKLVVASLRTGGFRLARTAYNPISYFQAPEPPYDWGSVLETFVHREFERDADERNPKGGRRGTAETVTLRIDIGVVAADKQKICYVVTNFAVQK